MIGCSGSEGSESGLECCVRGKGLQAGVNEKDLRYKMTSEYERCLSVEDVWMRKMFKCWGDGANASEIYSHHHV